MAEPRVKVLLIEDNPEDARVMREALGFGTVGVDRAGYRAGGADRPGVDEVLLSAICQC